MTGEPWNADWRRSSERENDHMSDLTDFLLARIAEDEALATADETQAQAERFWTVRRSTETAGLFDVAVQTRPWIISSAVDPASAQHIARHDPARVLAECAAKRRIIALASWTGPKHSLRDRLFGPAADEAFQQGIVAALRLLAAPYRDHAGFRPEWETQ